MLAAELEVSRSTVTDAYERLAAEGYVEGRHGGGTVVVGGALPRPPNHATSYSAVVPTLDAATIGRYGGRSSPWPTEIDRRHLERSTP